MSVIPWSRIASIITGCLALGAWIACVAAIARADRSAIAWTYPAMVLSWVCGRLDGDARVEAAHRWWRRQSEQVQREAERALRGR